MQVYQIKDKIKPSILCYDKELLLEFDLIYTDNTLPQDPSAILFVLFLILSVVWNLIVFIPTFSSFAWNTFHGDLVVSLCDKNGFCKTEFHHNWFSDNSN